MVSVVSVCAGEPKKGMGWYHLTQLLVDPAVTVRGVVEPWFLGPGRNATGAEAFATFQKETLASHPEVQFASSVAELKVLQGNGSIAEKKAPLLVLISGRTRDAPTLFKQVCEGGATHVFLEKPGAETTEQLSEMQALSTRLGVQVAVGYNKNVSEYVSDALTEIAKCGKKPDDPSLVVRLEHNNPFSREDMLVFIAGPGGEGMVHNMMCHELAIAVTYFGLRCESVGSVTLDESRSELVTLENGNTDWSRLAFCIKLKAGNEVNFFADRCRGNYSQVHIENGDTKHSFTLPSPKHAAWVEKEQAADPEIRGYFLLQSPDYKRLKSLLVEHIASGKSGLPAEVVCLDGAREVLKLADMLKPKLKELWQPQPKAAKIPRE